MSEEKKEVQKKVKLPTTVEEVYKDKSDEELQKLMFTYLTGDSGEQNVVVYDLYNELVRRTGEGEEVSYPGLEEGEEGESYSEEPEEKEEATDEEPVKKEKPKKEDTTDSEEEK